MASIKEKRSRRKRGETSPVKMLESELQFLRRDLRATVRAYAARLEIGLAESAAAFEFLQACRRAFARAAASGARSHHHVAESQGETREGPTQGSAQDRFAYHRPSLVHAEWRFVIG
jgi:hypothetical protein